MSTNDRIAKRKELRNNLLSTEKFLENLAQTPEIKLKLKKIKLEIQKLELETANNRMERADLKNETVENVNRSKNVELVKNNVEELIERLEEVKLNLETADTDQKSQLQEELIQLEEKIIKEPMDLSLWHKGKNIQAKLKGWFKQSSQEESREMKKNEETEEIKEQKQSYEDNGLEYETAPTTLAELNSLLQITIQNLGGSNNMEYMTQRGDKAIKIELNGNSFGFIYMELTDKLVPANKNLFEKVLSFGQKNKSNFDKRVTSFQKSYGADYPILAKLLSQNFSDRVPTKLVLLGNSQDQQKIGYFQCLIHESGNTGIVDEMDKPNNTYLIREVYREMCILEYEFGVQKLENQKK